MLTKEELLSVIAGGHLQWDNVGDRHQEYEELIRDRNDAVFERHSMAVNFLQGNPTPEGLRTMADTISTETERLRNEGAYDIEYLQMMGGMYISWRIIRPYEDWLNHTHRNPIEHLTDTWTNRVKYLIKQRLGINLANGGVRLIYVKLFIEGKITEEDLKDLVTAKDVDVAPHLNGLADGIEPMDIILNRPGVIQEELPENYVFINN